MRTTAAAISPSSTYSNTNIPLQTEIRGNENGRGSLTRKEKSENGGDEYRAMQICAWFVPAYILLWQVLGCLIISLYIGCRRREVAKANGVNPWWLGIFVVVSAFNNCGLSLLDDNMVCFH